MHLHIAKLNPAVRKALVTSAWGKTPYNQFITIANPVAAGHPLRAIFVPVRPITSLDASRNNAVVQFRVSLCWSESRLAQILCAKPCGGITAPPRIG